MCLAIPGKVVELLEGNGRRLAKVDLVGVTREVDVGLLDDAPPAVGDWVLVHVGFAMTRIDEAEARETLSMLRMMEEAFADPGEEDQAFAAADREELVDDVHGG